jgi:hypothetical protein
MPATARNHDEKADDKEKDVDPRPETATPPRMRPQPAS